MALSGQDQERFSGETAWTVLDAANDLRCRLHRFFECPAGDRRRSAGRDPGPIGYCDAFRLLQLGSEAGSPAKYLSQVFDRAIYLDEWGSPLIRADLFAGGIHGIPAGMLDPVSILGAGV